MLLVALAVFFGACYILYLRTLQSKLVLFGEKFPARMDPQASLIIVS